jgi:hypothetical protein
MFEQYQQPAERNKAILAMLVNMITVDRNLETIEGRFMLDVARQLNIPEEEIQQVLGDPTQYILSPPKNEKDRMTILYYLLFAMRVDGKIRPEEEALCFKAGLRLGFPHQMVADLIRVMKNHLHEEIPEDAMLNVIKKYLN